MALPVNPRKAELMLDQQVPVKRASATPEELAARFGHISRQPAGKLPPLPQQQTNRSRKTIEDGNNVAATPASVLRHRPLNREFVIPLVNGTELHVTERELLAMPQNYQDAAI